MTTGEGLIYSGGLSAIMLFVGLLYLIPTVIALIRKDNHTGGILILNLFLGWTILGWIGALIWAVSDSKKVTQ